MQGNVRAGVDHRCRRDRPHARPVVDFARIRLLHTTELRFEEFFGPKIPKYAILSHRWGDDGLIPRFRGNAERGCSSQLPGEGKLFDSLAEQCDLCSESETLREYGKIIACCRYAPSASTYDWVWIDTCCMNKLSSAEVSGTIKSMYKWYRESAVWYAYLSDVSQGDDSIETMTELGKCRWFTRGWTLQELLAPVHMYFLDKDWKHIGSRNEVHVCSTIARITGIAETHVKGFWYAGVNRVSVAEKMSWADSRTTTREEDAAYCLLGIFNINMPLLYGEGNKAFRRLQAEIIRSSNDESVFVWGFKGYGEVGLIADSAGQFLIKQSSGRSRAHENKFSQLPDLTRPAYTIKNQGLQLQVLADVCR